MMELINSGYIALVVVVVAFFGLQVLWISMTIRNGRNERVLIIQNQTAEIKKRVEKIFSKID